MNDHPKATPRDTREERLKQALRENLKRRKAQQRNRGESGSEADAAAPHDSAGIAADKTRP